jgi:hypothetical protein
MSQYQDLLQRAERGEISRQEIDMAADQLTKTMSDAEKHSLLLVLGHAGLVDARAGHAEQLSKRNLVNSYRGIVERFLTYKRDPLVARLALQVLCDYWGYHNGYLEDMLRFIRRVPWDDDGYVRDAAISIAGEYLRFHFEPRLLREVVRIVEDADEEKLTRRVAYTALARAMGRDWNQIPSAARAFDLASTMDPTVLGKAKDRLAQQGG